MLVLRTSNFQGATIRPIVPRHNTLLSLLFTTKFSLAGMQLKKTRIYLSKFPTDMESLGVSYFPLYPLQVIFHIYETMLYVNCWLLKKKPKEKTSGES